MVKAKTVGSRPLGLTMRSKGMAGLKNVGVLVKWILKGEVTMGIPVRSASTMSLPEGGRL